MQDITLAWKLNDNEYNRLLVSLKNRYADRICKYDYHTLDSVYDIRKLSREHDYDYKKDSYRIIFNVTIYYTQYNLKHTTSNIIINETKLNRIIKLLKLKEHA